MSKHQIQPVWRMSRLTRDGTAELASQDQILRGERRQGNIPSGANGDREIFLFPVQLTASKVDSLTYLVDPYFAICDGHKIQPNYSKG